MIRLTYYISLALLIALAAAWISANPGQVLLTWQGWEVRFSVAVFVMIILLYTFLVWASLRLFKWLNLAAYLSSPKRLAAKRKKADHDLDQAWSSYALGNYDMALKLGRRAKAKLGDDHNVLRLLAQAANAKGLKENPYLDILKTFPESAAWVQKLELDQLLLQKSWANALPLVLSMLEGHPKNSFLLNLSFLCSARLGKWHEAQLALQNAIKIKGSIDHFNKGHLRAVIEYCLALEKKAAGQKSECHTLLSSALKNDPSFAPAAALSARLSIEQGDTKLAEKILAAAWKKTQNKELADIILDLYPQESATETYRRVKKITESNPQSIDGQHLLATTAIDANHWPEARDALETSINSGKATKTTYQLLAKLEDKQKNDVAASEEYLKTSETAPNDKEWTCTDCNALSNHYVPICPECHEFDSIEWQNS